MAKTQDRPWEVEYEKYKALEQTLKPTPELIKTSISLSNRLNYKYGHVAAHLYLEWKARVGVKKATAWWASYEKRQIKNLASD